MRVEADTIRFDDYGVHTFVVAERDGVDIAWVNVNRLAYIREG